MSKYQNMEELILISQVQSSGWQPHMTKTDLWQEVCKTLLNHQKDSFKYKHKSIITK